MSKDQAKGETADANGELLGHLMQLGRVYSSNKTLSSLFKDLMEACRNISGAEGGSLYIYDWVSQTLKIVVLTNDVLGFHKVVASFDPLRIDGFIEVPMRDDKNQINLKNPSVCCFHKGKKFLIPNLDEDDNGFDFSKTRQFDSDNNYKTRNLAVFPLFGHGKQIIGVLQLVNAKDDIFSRDMRPYLDALSGQASIVLNNALLLTEAQNLLSAIVGMVSVAIDEKSPHTAGHCERVTALALMMADAMNKDEQGPYTGFNMNNQQRRELEMACMLHDVGKIITPAHIMEKPTKLYTLYDRVELLRERLRAWKMSEELKMFKAAAANGDKADKMLGPELATAYEEDYNFLNAVNRGEIFVDEKTEKRLNEIAARPIVYDEQTPPHNVIPDEEMKNLQVKRGTLNNEERKIMEDHVSASIRMLSSIPWPRNLERVVEYAGSHHESMNGKGYPQGLNGEQLSLPSRILCLADRFEAISAPDRPYRKIKTTLSRAMDIMKKMSEDGEIDSEMFGFFCDRKIYMDYANRYLPKELIDCA